MVPRTYRFQIFSKFLSPMLTKIIFVQDDSIIFLSVLKDLVIIRRVAGPDFDRIFEVPEII